MVRRLWLWQNGLKVYLLIIFIFFFTCTAFKYSRNRATLKLTIKSMLKLLFKVIRYEDGYQKQDRKIECHWFKMRSQLLSRLEFFKNSAIFFFLMISHHHINIIFCCRQMQMAAKFLRDLRLCNVFSMFVPCAFFIIFPVKYRKSATKMLVSSKGNSWIFHTSHANRRGVFHYLA